jgi:sugar lactone lactonase YvrE
MSGRGDFVLHSDGTIDNTEKLDDNTELIIDLNDLARPCVLSNRDVNDTLYISFRKKDVLSKLGVPNDAYSGWARCFTTSLNGKTFLSFNRQLYSFDSDLKWKSVMMKQQIVWMGRDNEGNLWVSPAYGGIYCYKNGDIDRKPSSHFLDGLTVSSMLQDNEGGYWLTTTEEGVFYFNNNGVLSYKESEGLSAFPLHCILKTGDSLWIGASQSVCYTLSRHGISEQKIDNDQREFQYIGLDSTTGNIYLCARDKLFLSKPGDKSWKNWQIVFNGTSVKDAWFSADGWIWCAGIDDLAGFKGNKRLYSSVNDKTSSRYNTILPLSQTMAWVGSNTGLHIFEVLDTDTPVCAFSFAGDTNALLKHGINDLARTTDGKIWAATRGNGLYVFHNGGIEVIRTENGLLSNTIRCIEPEGESNVWIGTTRGLHRVSWKNNKYFIETFTSADGLPGNEISDILFDEDTLYIICKNGVSVFLPGSLKKSGKPPLLHLESVLIQGTDTAILSSYDLASYQNQIEFRLTGLSYKSMGNIRYAYKLIRNGNDDENWQIVENNIIRFPYLPGGNYSFIAYAINKDGAYSLLPVTVKFSIRIPFYKRWYFYGLIFLAFLLIAFVFVYQRLKAAKEREKLNIKASGYMLKSLNRQLNPHFIYNALNTIQYYILNNDKESSNKYLARFASLMRQVLNNSQHNFITLRDELESLEAYMSLEAMRFKGRFTYSVTVEPEIDTHRLKIPPLLLQPLLENAVIHGLLPKDGDGLLTMHLSLKVKYIQCVIEDNGIGREKAETLKGGIRKHKSMGTEITRSRINLLNEMYKSDIDIMYEDLIHENGEGRGTRVTVLLPLIEE